MADLYFNPAMQNPVVGKQQEDLVKMQRKNNQLSIHTDVKADTCEEKSVHLIYGNKLLLRQYINNFQVSINATYAGSSKER